MNNQLLSEGISTARIAARKGGSREGYLSGELQYRSRGSRGNRVSPRQLGQSPLYFSDSPCRERLHGLRPVRSDLLGPIQNIGQSVGFQHSLLDFSAAGRNGLGAEELPQSCS